MAKISAVRRTQKAYANSSVLFKDTLMKNTGNQI